MHIRTLEVSVSWRVKVEDVCTRKPVNQLKPYVSGLKERVLLSAKAPVERGY